MNKKNDKKYTDFLNVENTRNYLTPEELPEGAYGAPVGKDEQVENKNGPWNDKNRHYQPYSHEQKTNHKNVQRDFPGAQILNEDET